MGIPLPAGRVFDARDRAEVPRVAVVDAELAKRFWKGADPIGKRMFLPSSAQHLIAPGPSAIWITVQGGQSHCSQGANGKV